MPVRDRSHPTGTAVTGAGVGSTAPPARAARTACGLQLQDSTPQSERAELAGHRRGDLDSQVVLVDTGGRPASRPSGHRTPGGAVP
ncbi:hypothetical protein, partial [Frankia canadensis]|uniref:hypothetical protein n=1 Tax=Frankia canadensis TaxID=1836972 RepID=UPI0010561F5D